MTYPKVVDVSRVAGDERVVRIMFDKPLTNFQALAIYDALRLGHAITEHGGEIAFADIADTKGSG